ncbi:MAG: DNA cytosine methyltransferase [Desulfobacteraceae bacterium]|nr:DNA cytosine methyltransferase [Desulfobacteraceae bacterium]
MTGLIVDLFAGGGGASCGIRAALGRDPDIAINHDAVAVAMHRANHPDTCHYQQDVWSVLPRQATKGQPVDLLWASPDCTHFSRAKGGPPIRDVRRRDLAWVVVRWAEEVRPRVICLENVEEFKTWGPLDESGKIIDSQKGTTFRSWVKRLRRLGYAVEFQCLRACDYGTPTSRKRLFMVARCDGLPIVWPAPTYGDPRSYEVRSGQLLPWRTAAEIIDWSIPCLSIFERKKSLAENTLKRIAEGIRRYVLEASEPFIVTYYGPKREGEFRGRGVDEPIPTQSTENRFGLVTPTLLNLTHGGRVERADDPLNTITCAHRGEKALVVPHLQRQFGQSVGNGADEPVGTITAGFGGKTALVTAFMAQHNGWVVGHEITEPVSTLTHRCTQQQLVTSNIVKYKGTSKAGQSVGEPLHTIQTGQHYGEVRAFLVKYFGTAIGQDLGYPTHTLTGKDRMGLVIVMVQGEPYVIVDIGMRMLTPWEQFRAQGFDHSYQIYIGINGRQISKSDQVRLCGNSVCPPIAEALVRANCMEHLGAELRRQMRIPL